MLHTWDMAWDLNEDLCPCDVHFVEFLQAQKISEAAIFHFGTGAHHFVGIRTARNGSNNSVLGITCSQGELASYVDLAVKEPAVSRSYKVMFGDIYLLDRKLLPEFDAVTLFHLCEFRDEQNDSYGAMSDRQLARMLIDKLRPGGWMLFYTGSLAFDQARPIISELVAAKLLDPAGEFRSLLAYRKAAAV